jgi:ABC-type spermidine/putrescine transport system permease subunit II
MQDGFRSPLSAALTVAALIFLVAPLAVVVLFSFHETASLSFPFTGFSLRWYRTVFSSGPFVSAVLNSTLVAAVTAVVTLVLGVMAAFALSRSRAAIRVLLALLFFLPITLPGLFIGLALLVFFARVRMTLSLTTVTLGHIIYVFPYFLLIAKAALDRMDLALEDAAADLGADPLRVFYKVTLPQLRPVLIGATALAFALSFDEFVITFFVIGSQSTLPLYIWSSMRRTIDPSINTISTLLMLITSVLFVIAFAATMRKDIARWRKAGAS